MSITNKIYFRNVKGDIFSGVTAAVIALPMALTFGVASGAGASAGLWGAILIVFFCCLIWRYSHSNFRTNWPHDLGYDCRNCKSYC
jgi:MFS superfamily sulfate permease-like transporter